MRAPSRSHAYLLNLIESEVKTARWMDSDALRELTSEAVLTLPQPLSAL